MNGGFVAIIYYFYSLYAMIVCANNVSKNVVHLNKGSDNTTFEFSEFKNYFGIYMKPYGIKADNVLKTRHEYLSEETNCEHTRVTCWDFCSPYWENLQLK